MSSELPPEAGAAITTILAAIDEVVAGNLRARAAVHDDAAQPLKDLAARLNVLVAAWRDSELRARQTKRALEVKVATVETQAMAIRELSVPVIEVWRNVLLLPIVGYLDERRATEIASELLQRVATSQANHVIIDITGVERVDERTADHLVRLVGSAALLGVRCIVSGAQPAVARMLVELGVDLKDVETHRTLEQGLKSCLSVGDRRTMTRARERA